MPPRIQMEPGWEGEVRAAWLGFGRDRLGPDIRDDARRFCPEDTGALAESLESHMEGDDVIVSATGSDERSYAAYVELGHRVFHPSTGETGPEVVPAEPFLRPALFQVRGE
jgi:hypothetical protein